MRPINASALPAPPIERRPLQKVDRFGGKTALTRYQVHCHGRSTNASYLLLWPLTGRTHQLRVHLEAIGHPILGDPLYGSAARAARAERLLLHAGRLAFAHPESGQTNPLLLPGAVPARWLIPTRR